MQEHRQPRRSRLLTRWWRWPVVAAAMLASTVACTESPTSDTGTPFAAGQIGRSPSGMVVSGSALATAVGREVLEQGGNAVDAAVATAFALAVAEPSMSGLGGRTQMLIRTGGGAFVGFDGTTEVPASYPLEDPESDEDAYGYATIGIPGTVAVLAKAASEYGTLPLPDLLAPAIELAEEGFDLPPEEAGRIAEAAARLAEFPGSRRHFLKPDGGTFLAGERFVQADLGRVLRAIAAGGSEVYYRGWIAESIAVDMERNGGYVTRGDLHGYEAHPALIVRGSYRGRDLVGTYLPASGATTIEALQILEQFDLGGRAGSAEWLALTTQALLLAFEDRIAELGPAEEKARTLVSKERAVVRAADVQEPHVAPAGAGMALRPVRQHPVESSHTTHLSTADTAGVFVALTQSIGPNMGSKVASPGLGFLYAATMGYLGALAPGDRPFSSQSPLFILQDDVPTHVLGAAGGRRIISAIVSVVSRMVDEGLSLEQAMVAPRLHPTGGTVYVEMWDAISWPAESIDALRSFGFNAEARSSPSYFARIHGIRYDAVAGEFVGVADPRWAGTAEGPRR